MNEIDFEKRIVDLAHTFGWRVAAFRPARTKDGWRTPCKYDAKGWPDLTLVHPDHGVLFREIKTEKNKPTPEQEVWIAALAAAGANVAVWRPADWYRIAEVLSAGRARIPREQP